MDADLATSRSRSAPEIDLRRAARPSADEVARRRRARWSSGCSARAPRSSTRFPGAALGGRPLRGRRLRLHRPTAARAATPVLDGRLRHHRGRHRPRPHRARLRRGRLPARRAVRDRRSQNPVRLDGTFDERVPDFAGRARQGRQPRDRRRRSTRAGRLFREAGLRARLPALLALRHAAPLLREVELVHRAPPRSATGCSPRTRGSAGTPSTSSTAASASGSRTTSTGRSRATATGARRCRSGSAPARAATSASAPARSPELRERAGGDVPEDLHRPYIDERDLDCESCGGEMRRVESVIDTWYDSGAMPFAQFHYPFENEELFERALPGRLHLRGDRPDPRLVLLAARRVDAALRPDRATATASASA